MRLQEDVQNVILAALEADFNLGQFGQLECVGASLNKLKEVAVCLKGKKALHFCLFGMFLVIAGAPFFKGQVPGPVWKGFFESIEALSELTNKEITPDQVYSRWSEKIKEKLNVKNYLTDGSRHAVLEKMYSDSERFEEKGKKFKYPFELNKYSSFDDFLLKLQRAILRLARMLRCNDDKLLPDIFLACCSLDPKSLSILVFELNKTGIDDGWAILIMYSPKLLQNRIADKKSIKSQSERLAVGLNCLVHLYSMARLSEQLPVRDVNHPNGVFEVNCYNVAVDFSTDELCSKLDSAESCFSLDFKRISGTLGEAEIRIERG
jgi:hypothetical protein